MSIQMVVAALSEVVRVPLRVLGRVMAQLTGDFSMVSRGLGTMTSTQKHLQTG